VPSGQPRTLSKNWEACPTLTLFADRLIGGRVASIDAVFLWDSETRDERTALVNIEIGLLPAGALTASMTATEKAAWSDWSQQWRNQFGGGLTPGWMSPGPLMDFAYTPERLFAQWLSLKWISEHNVAATRELLVSRIHGFSLTLVDDLVRDLHEAET
jgi:hypothetical protein